MHQFLGKVQFKSVALAHALSPPPSPSPEIAVQPMQRGETGQMLTVEHLFANLVQISFSSHQLVWLGLDKLWEIIGCLRSKICKITILILDSEVEVHICKPDRETGMETKTSECSKSRYYSSRRMKRSGMTLRL